MSRHYLAIDPGSKVLGWALVSRDDNDTLTVVDSGAAELRGENTLERIIAAKQFMLKLLTRIHESSTYEIINLKGIFVENYFPQARKGAKVPIWVQAAVMVGAFEYLEGDAYDMIAYIASPSIKLCVAGSGKASKKEMAQALRDTWGMKPKTKHPDETDAIAICITGIKEPTKRKKLGEA